MSLQQQLFFIFASIATVAFIIIKIRKNKMNIDDSIIWILWAFLLLVFSLFPNFAAWISKSIGFMSSSNFILSLFVFFLYIIVFNQNVRISNLTQKNKELIQKLSLKEYKTNHKGDQND